MYQPQTSIRILDVDYTLSRGKQKLVQWTVNKSKCKTVSGKVPVTTYGKPIYLLNFKA
jgi:hypothetical protein